MIPRRMLMRVAVSQFLAMTLWFSATAAAPAIAADLGISGARVGWLTMAVQAGFVTGTLLSALLNLADVLNARRLFAAGCVAGALANAAITQVDSSTAVILLRFATGVALACVYPPGMKIVAGWFREGRGTALGVMVGALTVGTAFPHLLAWAAADVPWRALMGLSSLLALVGGAVVTAGVTDGPYVAASAPFDANAVRLVVGNRDVRLATLGYLGHMWELYAMWTWLPAFAAASLSASGRTPGTRGSLIAFAAITSGALGCVLAGQWADRWGKARIAGGALISSATCSLLTCLVFGAPPPLLVALSLIWGFTVVADSAQFSALVAEFSPPTHVGTALTLQTCAGFLLTMVTLRGMPAVAGAVGWRWAFLLLAPGPLLGSLAMARLRHRPVSAN